METRSAEETRGLGERLGKTLKQGDVLALRGELGAGKTVLVQGLARGLGADPGVLVTSPTFVILHEYPGRTPLYHFDFYRLAAEKEALDLGLDEYLEGEGVAAVEWADKFPALFGPQTLWVDFQMTGENSRRLELCPGKAWDEERRKELERTLISHRDTEKIKKN